MNRSSFLPRLAPRDLALVAGGSGKGQTPNLTMPNTLSWLNANKPLPQTPNIPKFTSPNLAQVQVSGSGQAWTLAASASTSKGSISTTIWTNPSPYEGKGITMGVSFKK